jgi:hypothetical protein
MYRKPTVLKLMRTCKAVRQERQHIGLGAARGAAGNRVLQIGGSRMRPRTAKFEGGAEYEARSESESARAVVTVLQLGGARMRQQQRQ